MKLVTEYLTAGEAELAASHLEAAGIATFVSNSDSARLPIATSNAGGLSDCMYQMIPKTLFERSGDFDILLELVRSNIKRRES